MNEKCFAMKKTPTREGVCSCLEKRTCPGYMICPFYKPVWVQERDRRRKFERLATLPEAQQLYISEKYYQGKMPWRGDEV